MRRPPPAASSPSTTNLVPAGKRLGRRAVAGIGISFVRHSHTGSIRPDDSRSGAPRLVLVFHRRVVDGGSPVNPLKSLPGAGSREKSPYMVRTCREPAHDRAAENH